MLLFRARGMNNRCDSLMGIPFFNADRWRRADTGTVLWVFVCGCRLTESFKIKKGYHG